MKRSSPTGATQRLRPASAAAAGDKPSLAKVVSTLKHAVERMQLVQGIAEQQAEREQQRVTVESHAAQVELLQNAFTALSDAVQDELDELAGERLKVQKQQAAWGASIKALEESVQAKLGRLGGMEERLMRHLAASEQLPGKVDGLGCQQRATSEGLDALRADVQVLTIQLQKLERTQNLAATDAAAARLNTTQFSQVKELARGAVHELVPGLVAAGIGSHVPAMIDEVVECRSGELRAEFASAVDMVAAAARLAHEGAALRADVAAMSGHLRRCEADLAALGPRVNRVEAAEASNPKASVRLVAALEEQLNNLAAQQSRHSRSIEGVVAAVVDDTVGLSGAATKLQTQANLQQAQLQDTKEALLRSAQVFSHLLKVPSPVSPGLWHGSLSARTYAASPTATASSPRKAHSPGSKYASLLSGL